MGPINTFEYLFAHVAAVLDKQIDKTLSAEAGISLSQYRILMIMEWNPRMSQSAIAEALGQSEAGISRQIKAMEKKGLVISSSDPLNYRKHIPLPSPLGMQAAEAAGEIIRKQTGEMLNGQLQAKLQDMIDNLQALHKKVCRNGKPGACNHPLGI